MDAPRRATRHHRDWACWLGPTASWPKPTLWLIFADSCVKNSTFHWPTWIARSGELVVGPGRTVSQNRPVVGVKEFGPHTGTKFKNADYFSPVRILIGSSLNSMTTLSMPATMTQLPKEIEDGYPILSLIGEGAFNDLRGKGSEPASSWQQTRDHQRSQER